MDEHEIDVASLPELKVSTDTFEALGEFGTELPDVRNGFTWKRQINPGSAHPVHVICRYRTHEIGGPITIEILRPAVTAPLGNTHHQGYRRKKR